MIESDMICSSCGRDYRGDDTLKPGDACPSDDCPSHDKPRDITNRILEAAIIDQKAAGAFAGLRYAFVAVIDPEGFWALGVAVQNEQGYSPIHGKRFDSHVEAKAWATGLNEHIGLSDDAAIQIVCSTMGKRKRDAHRLPSRTRTGV